MSFSNTTESGILDLIFGGQAYSAAATHYVALFTAAPTDGSAGTEVSGGSYARVALTNNSTNWPAASSGSKANGGSIAFPTATADWGTVVAFGIFTASSGGTLIAYGSITPNQSVPSGVTTSFSAGQLTITLD
ncbi:MAG: phage tail fiber protein [Kofleriaceae bacterium]